MRSLSFVFLTLLAACSGGGDDPPQGTDTGPTDDPGRPGVIRDCPADVGTICPWAGAGYNGFNGDDVDRLDAWFSFPMSILFSEDHDPVLADWNNHKLRKVLANPEDGFETIMGTAFLGDGDPDQKDSTPEGAPGTTVNLNHPTQNLWLPDGTMLATSWHTHNKQFWTTRLLLRGLDAVCL